MYDDGHVRLVRDLELGDKELDLGPFVAEFAEIVQADLAEGHHVRELKALLDRADPVLAWVGHFRRGHAYGMVHGGRGFEGGIYDAKVMETVADADDTGDVALLSFLYDTKLLDGIIVDKPDMGVSIKNLHGFHPGESDGNRPEDGYTLEDTTRRGWRQPKSPDPGFV